MRIPSGDLAPARRRRRGYSSRRGRPRPLLIALAASVVLAVAGGGYLLRSASGRPAAVTSAAGCPSPAATATPRAPAPSVAVRLPAAAHVQFRMLNGTGRSLLAKTVGDALAARGFRVAGMGNAPRQVTGETRIYFGPGGRPAALLLSTQILDSAVVPVASAAPGAVDVVLGTSFVRLRSPAEASAYAASLQRSGAPATRTGPRPTARCP